MLFMGLVASAAALGLFVGAVWAFFSQRQKMAGRVAALGTVVELTTQSAASASASLICPVVEFTVPSGEKFRFVSDFGSRPASHSLGQSVNVRYDALDPKKAEIQSVMNVWLIPLILIFMGLVACCLGVFFLGFASLGAAPFAPMLQPVFELGS